MSPYTTDDCIEAVRQILIQLYDLEAKGLSSSRIGRIERETIFFLYEGTDKYGEHQPHSKKARGLRRTPDFSKKLITYDHAIPLATLRPGFKSAVNSFEELKSFLNIHVRGVVITREEDKTLNKALRRRLPDGAATNDLLARYAACGIEFESDDKRLLLGR